MNVGVFSKKIIQLYKEGSYSFDVIELSDIDDQRLEEVDALIIGSLKNESLDKFTKLRDIFIPFTGKNGFDEGYVNELGINLHSTSVHAKFVAERAFSLSLSILGRIVEYDERLRRGEWSRRNFDDRVSWDTLFNKKVGIYGYGSIGQWIEKMVAPFDCDVQVLSRTKKRGVSNASSLEELVEHSDIVYICVPLNDETREVFNKKILDTMNEKILVNIARGPIVHEEDLYNALRDKTLLGYASDVWFNYPKRDSDKSMPSRFPLEEQRVVMTPHCGGFTVGAERMRYLDTLDQIEQRAKL